MVPAISLRGVRRAFGHQVAVDDLDLVVQPGEIYGLVGPDGAGKTTTVRLIAGLIDPDAGEVRVVGLPPDDPHVRESTGLLPQRYSLYGDLSIGENLEFFRQLFNLSPARARPRIERLLDITRLGPFLARRADALSGGMYKKLALACALLHEPKVLLLDEPTNGVDPVSRRELWELLGELVGGGMALLVTTPYMDEAERCHRVGLMHHGRLLTEGTPTGLVKAFPHAVVVVDGLDRAAAERLVGGDALATSPAGAALRAVLPQDRLAAVGARLADHGGALRAVRPSFEDLFLSEIA